MTLGRRSRESVRFNIDEMKRQRLLADMELQKIRSLTDGQKEILRECYVQKNSPETAAYKLDISLTEARMWYYRLSVQAVRNALNEARHDE